MGILIGKPSGAEALAMAMEQEFVPQTARPPFQAQPSSFKGFQKEFGKLGISRGLPPGFSPGLPKSPLWLKVVPFFLSALVFLSALLAIFAPLPLLVTGLSQPKGQRRWTALVGLINALIVFGLGGKASCVTYVVFVLTPSFILLECLLRKKSLELMAAAALLGIVLAGAGAVTGYSRVYQAHPVAEARAAVSQFVDYVAKASTENGASSHLAAQAVQDPADLEDWKQNLMVELPSALAVMALVMIWANLVTLLRMNPGNIRTRLSLRPDFFQVWKAPEWLIWPTILAGLTLLVNFGVASDVGRNVFKFLMAIYALQGLSVLSSAFLRWKVKKYLRILGFGVAVLVMMPLLLSLGFFDLWFDFRAKFRQS